MSKLKFTVFLVAILYILPFNMFADDAGMLAVTATPGSGGSTAYSLNIKLLAAMTFLTLMPALLMTVTSFTRVIIVLAILRQAMGMPNIPTNQILIGISLLITFFIMSPIANVINTNAIQPYVKNQISEEVALDKAMQPLREFMLKQTRNDDLNLFMQMSHTKPVTENKDIPFPVLMTAFVTSELKTAFQIGFLLFIPFLIIDLVVASVLMSMGMMMLSPLVISLPFKIMLFVLVNGWVLVIGTLSSSFGIT